MIFLGLIRCVCLDNWISWIGKKIIVDKAMVERCIVHLFETPKQEASTESFVFSVLYLTALSKLV